MNDETKLSTSQVRQRVREELDEAVKHLEKVRHLMVYADKDGTFHAIEVHKVALVQYELGKLVEAHDPRERRKR